MREVSLLGYCRVLPTPYGWVDWIICCLLTSSTVLDCLLYVLVKVWPPNVASEYAFHLDHTDETHITAPWWVLSSLLRWGWARGELLLPAIPTVQPLEHEKVSGLYGSTFSSLVLWQIRPRPQICESCPLHLACHPVPCSCLSISSAFLIFSYPSRSSLVTTFPHNLAVAASSSFFTLSWILILTWW